MALLNAVAHFAKQRGLAQGSGALRILPEVDYVTLCSASSQPLYKMINSGESLENLKHHENTCGEQGHIAMEMRRKKAGAAQNLYALAR